MNSVVATPGSTYVVEDHDLVRSLLTAWFVSRGHRVRPCGPSNLQALDDIDPDDLVVLDLCLGDRDGVDVLQRLADRRFAGAIILISSFSDTLIETARHVGIDFGLHVVGALRKPVVFDRLDALLGTIGHRPPPADALFDDTPSLAGALASDGVVFHYQPILDARTLEVCSIEALARLVDVPGRVVSIATALAEALAEDLHDLARIAVVDAERLAKYLLSRGVGPLPMSINVPSSLVQRRHIAPILDRLDPAGPQITFEVSEIDSFSDLREARRATTSAVLRGLRFSLDDFGTVNSNIDRLMQIPFDEVKIDRAFVAGCAEDPFRDAVCRSAVQLARLRRAVVVAEGVETVADFEHLCRLGVDRVQGYLFSRPLAGKDVADWILAHRAERRAAAIGDRPFFTGEERA